MIMINFRFFNILKVVFIENKVSPFTPPVFTRLSPFQHLLRRFAAFCRVKMALKSMRNLCAFVPRGFRFDFWVEMIRRDNFSSICNTSSCTLPLDIGTKKNVKDENDILAWHKLNMIINHRLLSSPMIVNQWHSERINQLLVPTLRPSASAPALGVD